MLDLSSKGHYCSQITLTLGLEAQGKRDPGLVRAMAGVACGAILEGGGPQRDRCGETVVNTYAKTVEILVDHGLDPAGSRDG
jgi:hypothetical protein